MKTYTKTMTAVAVALLGTAAIAAPGQRGPQDQWRGREQAPRQQQVAQNRPGNRQPGQWGRAPDRDERPQTGGHESPRRDQGDRMEAPRYAETGRMEPGRRPNAAPAPVVVVNQKAPKHAWAYMLLGALLR